MSADRLTASFRDPAGFIVEKNGVLYRQVLEPYRPHYEALMHSGLYRVLTDRRWLVSHDEVPAIDGAYRTLRPMRVPYVSYPYEWSFGQLKDAALLTLDIQQASLAHGLVLKDASAYNVQFVGAQPLFIDTLSFEVYEEGRPWAAYRQFCEHFLGPLALMSHTDLRLRRLLAGFVDGLPLDLVSRLLPRRTWGRPGLLAHVHLHARSQLRHARTSSDTPVKVPTLKRSLLIALVDGLRRAVQGCALSRRTSTWADYYDDTNYSAAAMAAKEQLVVDLVDLIAVSGRPLHDLGANTGRFSRLLARDGRYVIAHDLDELAVERHYRHNRSHTIDGVLPLVLDLANPSPALGWALEERASAVERLSGGTVVALALVHHLAIANNVPLDRLAGFFGTIAASLVIEFVPKEDSQVRRLLASRPDIFPGYSKAGFEHAFAVFFEIVRVEAVPGTSRTLYAMRRRQDETTETARAAGG
ncbi:MAG: SAM-dependent methyltransferase [Vicinamibacterales bacterium]